jgi:hypothetical protein
MTIDIPKGRPLSTSEIQSPKPINPKATQYILQGDYSAPTVEELTSRFSTTTIEEEQYSSYYDEMSPPSSVGSSLSSRSDSSSPSSASSLSDYSTGSDCRCERYGITRAGDRVKLDCGGSRCGYSDDDSSCCSSDDEYERQNARRNGIVVRRWLNYLLKEGERKKKHRSMSRSFFSATYLFASPRVQRAGLSEPGLHEAESAAPRSHPWLRDFVVFLNSHVRVPARWEPSSMRGGDDEERRRHGCMVAQCLPRSVVLDQSLSKPYNI